ncbi:MAG: putative enoyl-CoA hydratase [Naasia sp.]|nr:putative enoyl-CoA hydratase [Naasia sp.]
MTDAPAEPEVLVEREGRALRLILNRPRQINALTLGMIHRIEAALDAAVDDDTVQVVILAGAGDRGLCAGGDITMNVRGEYDKLRRFWATEYDLIRKISAYPKPFVSLMDGITMGGGIGLSAHSAYRIVTERTRIAMPEVRIGFFPDVGGTLILGTAPGHVGTHLALTAGDCTAGDAIYVGFASHFVPSGRLPDLVTALASGDESTADTVARFAEPPPEATLAAEHAWIDAAYDAEDVEQILANLDARPEAKAHEAAATIRAMAPTGVVMARAALLESARLGDLDKVLRLELHIGHSFIGTWDFIEGVRAQIIDKDRNPQWRPATVAEVDRAQIAEVIATAGI